MRISLPSVLGILIAVSPFSNDEMFAQGCTLGSVTLNVVPAPQPTITGNNQFCEGGSTTLTVPQNFDSYLWSNNDTDQSTTVNSPGTYTVTVTNSAGCTGTATYTVTQSPAPIPAITSAFYNCNGTFTISVTSGFAAYNWSSGQTTDTIFTNGDGTYEVTVTDANGCTGTTAVTVIAPPDPVVTITGNNIICANESTVLQATPGFLLYSWSTGGNGESITVTNAGTYSVTVTNAFGCTDSDSFTVSQNPAPSPTISGPPAICDGQSGTLTVTPSFAEYLWSTSETTQSIDVSGAGAYTVTVTDANGCTGTATFTLTVNPNPVPVISAAPYACNGQITLSVPTGFASYNWSTNQPGNSITVNADGTYGLTVTDANGCSGTATIDVNIPPPPMVDITGDNQICANGSGTLDATPGFSNYAWSPSGNGPSITVNSAGTYTVTATDAFGCTDTATFAVTSTPAPTPTISGPPAICDGQSGTLTVTPSFAEYLWSTSETTQSIDVSGAGTYTVTVTDANNCTGTASFTLAVNPIPTPIISAAPYACNGQITLSVPTGFASYNWSTNQSGSTITVNADGTYTVTVTDANGCSGTDDFVVAIPAPPAVAITGNTEFCQGDNSSLEATPGLNAYVWSTNQTGPNITVFNAGIYTVTASDGFGCTATASITISILPAPVPTINGPASICSTESATLEVPGSFGSYVWSNAETGPSITVSTAGTYVVTVTDFSGCTGTAAHTLTVLPSPQPNITAGPYQCNDQLVLNAGPGFSTYLWNTNQTINPITVNADDDYSVTVTAANGCTGTDTFFADIPDDPVVEISGNSQICQGGNTVLTATPGLNAYVWSNAQTGNSITVNAAGNYGVTATDGFGCTATDVFPVQVVPNPVPTIAGPNSICAGGSATFSVPGNFDSYLWSTTETTNSITVSNAGTYTVTVTDANGCTGTASKTLNISSSLEPQIAEQPYNCNGQITLDAGTGFSTYLWSTSETTSTITVNTSDLYTVTVTDNTGCSGTAEVAVNIPDPPVVGISGPNVICQNASATLEATPGFGIYVWSNNQVGPSITVNQANTYTVTATDGYGCTAETSFDLAVNPAPTTSIDGPQSICANSSGTLTAVGAFSSYAWSNMQNSQSIPVNAAGTYTVTVTNSFGCTGTAAQTVSVVTALNPQLSALPYACDGQITLQANAGFATYLWSTGETTPSISVTADDTYTVLVTDASGCTGTGQLAVTIPDPPVVAVSGNPNFCANSSTALSATPGFVSYLWSTTETTSDITVNATGNYGVTVTDALGCTATASLTATAQPLPTPQISGPAAICTNSSGTLSVGGNFASYSWSTAETTPSITVNTAGNFGVTVTDVFGCTGSTAQSVSVVTQLTPTVSALPYACNGQITLEASAGFAGYLWSTGETTPSISVTADDTYTVLVTDASGCTGTGQLAVTIPDPPVVAVSGNPNFCANSSTALSATPGFVSYLWSTTETTSDITVNATGTYTVTVTDVLGCTATAALSATAQPLPTPQISGPAAICTNSSGTLTVGGNFAAYMWSTAETTPSITVNAAGNFGVTVTDVFGCTGSTAQSVSVVTQLTPTVSALPYACNGQITLEAGAGFAGYLWSTGETTPSISVATDNTYTVVVTDASGCTGTGQLAVTVPDPPVVAVSGNPNFCANSSTALSATPGFVSYLWSTSETTPGITVNATGNYGVTVTDALGCTATAFLAATAQPLPTPTINGPAAICTNSSGTLTVGGNFAAYAWSTAETTPSITVNTAGNFGVTVTDVFGCTGSTAQSVSVVTQLTPTVSALPYACNGQITLEASAGFAGYLWSTGETTPTISVATDDTYTVVVTDASGCTGTGQLAVTIPDPPVVAVSGNPNFCENSSTALSATPGFVSYLWSTTETTSDITVNATGNYAVTVTDALGCTATASLAATAQPLPTPTINGPAAICTNSSGTLTVGGNFAAYAWSTA
ncbi:MAG: hypothetical protein JNJ90_04520, partial [Saprospiraceae bacterium]|nr:hypothetical protein [Saprospiraceae bacterium]